MSNLFIIGNGFDIAHDYKTKYSDFKQWIETQIPDPNPCDVTPQGFFITPSDSRQNYLEGLTFLKELLDDNVDLNSDWNNFEDSLTSLPIFDKYESLIDDVLEPSDIFENPGRYDDVCVNNASLVLDNVKMLPIYFKDWINSVDVFIPSYKLMMFKFFCHDSLFINFNYTETLESVYGIDSSQICYIHGSRRRTSDELVIGHSDMDFTSDKVYDCPSASSILDEAIDNLKKDTGHIIDNNSHFMSRIDEGVTDIYTYGFAYGKQDIPYIMHINNLTNGKAKWHLSDYDSAEKIASIKSLLRKIGCTGEIDTFDHRSIPC